MENLSTKYRPATFSEVIGQDIVVNVLKRIAQYDGIAARAIFLHGSWGSGKTTTARIFAKALNCKNFKKTGDVCNECDGCHDASTQNSQLYYEFDSSSVGNVEGIQMIDSILQTIPNGRRCVVLDEIHSASRQALNALLKIVEEGRNNTIFVFCSTEAILPTLMSRSICLDVTTIPVNLIKNRLLEVARCENISISEEDATAIAYKSGGHMRDALSLLQLYALAGKVAVETAIASFHTFICKCLKKEATEDDVLDILKYPITNINDSINQYIVQLYLKDEKYADVAKTGIQASLFNYFYSPVVAQAMKSEAGIQIALTNLRIKLCQR